MQKLVCAVFAVSVLSVTAAAQTGPGLRSTPPASPCGVTAPAPQPMSCTAAGHPCKTAEDCCSRMCDKKTGKCH